MREAVMTREKRKDPDGRPYVAMSGKSLSAVLAWHDENEDDDLAKAYAAANWALNGVLEFREDGHHVKAGIRYDFYSEEVVQGMYIVRDHIGRQILKRIKRDAGNPL